MTDKTLHQKSNLPTKESESKLRCIACKRVITSGTIRQHKNYHKSCYNRLFKRGRLEMSSSTNGLLPLIGTKEPKLCIRSSWLKKQQEHEFITCHCGRLRCCKCDAHQQKDGSWT